MLPVEAMGLSMRMAEITLSKGKLTTEDRESKMGSMNGVGVACGLL
jgi:hypothetical protein